MKIIIEEVRNNCKKDPLACGFNTSENAYEPLKLMQSVILQVNEICLRYMDNSMLCSLPSPGPPYNLVSYYAVKNTRRRMEDRHVVVHDLNTIFNKNEVSPSSYYAIFDGHGGQEAAAYGAAHLHQYLAESKSFAGQPDVALTEAFCRTDLLFIEKCKVENFSGGSTAVCALLRPKEKSLFVAWVGDSQAILSRQGLVEQCVHPHKPDREDERERIEKTGGNVVFWGTWRVNGQLAVSRAIGDLDYKPYISAVPDVREYTLDGTEDFLVMACDGLWDVMRDDDAAKIVYDAIYESPDTVTDTIAKRLVQDAKISGSSDNISVIVVFLKDPAKIAAEPRWEIRVVDERMEAGFESTTSEPTNPFASTNGADILATHQKDAAFLLDLDGFRPSNAHAFMATNGKEDYVEDLDDLGPETDVDAVDEVQSPAKLIAGMSEELEEKVAKEIDANLLKSVAENRADSNLEHDDDDDHEEELPGVERKEETPTPPADEVHDAGLDSDSEDDEWNYIKNDNDDKENAAPVASNELQSPVEPHAESAPTVDENEENEEIDNMSQLNPNAEEFVPVSPTRMEHRPDWSALKDDKILAQSPGRNPNPYCELTVPEENDFVEGVRHRPSDVCSNGHENGHKPSSQEMLENLLNGKNIDEIEFQPTGSPSKTAVGAAAEQFIFGPNSAAFSTPTKYMDQSRTSTKANYGDDSMLDESDLLDRLNKEKDPMSMSFYQDKEDDETPFDVDKEEKDTDEKEQEEPAVRDFDDSVSDLPEHEPLANAVTTDLDRKEEEEEDMGVCALPKSPLPAESVESENMSDMSPMEPERVLSPEQAELVEDVSNPLLDFSQPEAVEDERKFATDDEIIERPQEPLVEVGAKSPLPDLISEEHEVEDFASNEHFEDEAQEPVGHPEPVVCYASREAELFQQEAASEDISESSDVHQQEFIPETSLEVAQSPEPVVLDYTPDQEAPPVIPEGVHKLVEEQVPEPEACSLPEPEVCPIPAPIVCHLLEPLNDDVQPVTTPEAIESEILQEQIQPVMSPEPVHEPEVIPASPEPVHEQELSPASPEPVHEPEMIPASPEPVQEPEVIPASPEPVHEPEVIPVSPEPVQEPEVIPASPEPVQEPEVIPASPEPVQAPEVIPSSPEPVQSPLVESPVVDMFEKHVGDLLESETPKVVEPVLKMAEDVSPVADTCEVPEVITPVEDVTSSVKDDSPVEEIKEIQDDLIPDTVATPEPPVQEPEVTIEEPAEVQPKEEVIESPAVIESPVAEVAAVAAAAAAVTAAAVGAGVVAEAEAKKSAVKARTSTSGPIKKAAPATKTAAAKPLASTRSPAAKPATARAATASKTAPPKTSTTKPATTGTAAAKAPTKPRVPLSAAAKPADKKPLTNGDAKAAPAPKVPPIRRPQVPSTTKTIAAKTTTAATKPPTTTTAKPAATKSATSTLKSATSKTATGAGTTAAAPKPRPTTLSARTTTTTKTTTTSRPLSSTTSTTTTRTVTSKTSTTSAAPKPKSATAPAAKPRVPLSARTTTARTPADEKQNKENVNKLTASRTAATKTTTTTRKVDVGKTASATKSSTLNKAPITKKPLAKSTNGQAPNKPKEEPKEKIVPNGLAAEKEKDASINEADQLVKDLSPVNLILDNSQLADATAD